jgi:hypothetical protein
MAKAIEEVRVAVDGVLAVAPVGATAPTDAAGALDVAFVDLGYVSEDGVTETTEQSSEDLRAWQNAKVVRRLITEGGVTYQAQLIQTSADTVALYYGGEVAADGSIVINPSSDRPTLAFVLDVIDGDDRIRAYIPEGIVTEVGDQVYANGQAIGYDVTITASYNETLGGSVKKWFSALDTTP